MHMKFAKKFIMMFMVLGMTLVVAGIAAPEVHADTAVLDEQEMNVTQDVEGFIDDDIANDELITDDPSNDDPSNNDPAEGDEQITEPEDDSDAEVDQPEEILTGWHKGFYYDSEGNKTVSEIVMIDGKLYIFDARGDSDLFNDIWVGSDGKPYLIKEGLKDENTVYLYNGKFYKNGVLYSGGYQYVYYKSGVKSTANKSTVKKVEDGKFYYFNSNGEISRTTGWLRLNGKRYYVRGGDVCTGWNYVDGYKYYFYTSTAYLCQDLIKNFANDNWEKKVTKIMVNRKKNCVTLYAVESGTGVLIPVKALICSVGLPDTPTITGTYTLTASRTYRWSKLGGPTMGGYCWGQYCTRINGGYLFHSVTYNRENDPYSLSTRAYNNLGKAASHGCVRLQVIDAKLIYDIVRDHNVTVTIYDSSTVGPFDKPVISKIPSSQKYEPTDPNIKK